MSSPRLIITPIASVVLTGVDLNQCARQVPGNDAYRLDPMPVPAVIVALKGSAGGLLIDETTSKEVR